MGRKKVYGTCRICGNEGKLSFEHVPPEKAFNYGRFHYESDVSRLHKMEMDLGDEMLDLAFNKSNKYVRKKQGGIGFNTLCEKCNNRTGSWYGSDYTSYVMQAMAILLKSNGQPTLYYPTYFFPLRVIKQVITMFFSLKLEGFNQDHRELEKFVLNREQRFLSNKYRIYCYYNLRGSMRYLGDNIVSDIVDGRQVIMNISELTFPPFGFVFTIDSEKPDMRLTDISYFANYRYNDWTDCYQKLNTLPTYLPQSPVDYRTKEEIVQAMIEGRSYMQNKDAN